MASMNSAASNSHTPRPRLASIALGLALASVPLCVALLPGALAIGLAVLATSGPAKDDPVTARRARWALGIGSTALLAGLAIDVWVLLPQFALL